MCFEICKTPPLKVVVYLPFRWWQQDTPMNISVTIMRSTSYVYPNDTNSLTTAFHLSDRTSDHCTRVPDKPKQTHLSCPSHDERYWYGLKTWIRASSRAYSVGKRLLRRWLQKPIQEQPSCRQVEMVMFSAYSTGLSLAVTTRPSAVSHSLVVASRSYYVLYGLSSFVTVRLFLEGKLNVLPSFSSLSRLWKVFLPWQQSLLKSLLICYILRLN